MATTFVIENPKRRISIKKGSAGWYDYYAGFSPQFAKSLLESSGLDRESVVADPWNGSGTTTEMASVLGFKAYGFDLNPVMLVIAKARMLNRRAKPSMRPLTSKIIRSASSQNPKVSSTEPLGQWFTSESAISIRKLEAATQELLIDPASYKSLSKRDLSKELSDIAAFFYNAIFRTVRKILSPFLGSNPTWIRKAKDEDDKLSIDLNYVLVEFRIQVDRMLAALDDVLFCHLQDECYLGVAPSNKIPLTDASVDLVLSSPPYCTRIDYAVATSPELAILGFDGVDLRSLREKLIGTSTISKSQHEPNKDWGVKCNALLRKIRGHSSKASATYYYKNHLQYFCGMFDSLGECLRILKPDGHCVLVVQDSYYKELHNDLPQIIIEMCKAIGLSLDQRSDFAQSRTLAGVNPAVKEYRKTFGATEAVLRFKAAN